MEENQVFGHHDLADVVIERAKHILGIAELVDRKALMTLFGKYVAEDRRIRRVESQ